MKPKTLKDIDDDSNDYYSSDGLESESKISASKSTLKTVKEE